MSRINGFLFLSVTVLGLGICCMPETLGAIHPGAPQLSPADARVLEESLNQELVSGAARFERNQGQTDDAVKFLFRGRGYQLFLTPNEAVFVMRPPAPRLDKRSRLLEDTSAPAENQGAAIVRMRLEGGALNPVVEGLEKLPGTVNYFIGNDPSQWRRNVPTYARVRYRDVYPGIDLVYHRTGYRLEYDFVVAPGADPNLIELAWEGMDALELDDRGALHLQTALGGLEQTRPRIYQEADGGRNEIEGGFVARSDGRIGFELADYNTELALVIDPQVAASSVASGSGTDAVYTFDITFAGGPPVVHAVGATDSVNLDTTMGSFQPQIAGGLDCLYTRLNFLFLDGATEIQDSTVTYIGGPGDDSCNAVAVDPEGRPWIAGAADLGWPPVNADQADYGGGGGDAVVALLSADGQNLLFSTYYGGNGVDTALDIVIDDFGNGCVVGATDSDDLTTEMPIQDAYGGGPSDIFVAQFNESGTLLFSTYVGGDGEDAATSSLKGANGELIVGGFFDSTNLLELYPSVNPIGPLGEVDGLVLVLDGHSPSGAAIGGSGQDLIWDLALGPNGEIHFGGESDSGDFPTVWPFQPMNHGGTDCVFGRLAPDYTVLNNGSYLGGTEFDACYHLGRHESTELEAMDLPFPVPVITGVTRSADFSAWDGPPTREQAPWLYSGNEDAFLAAFSQSAEGNEGVTVARSIGFIGGSGSDIPNSLGVITVETLDQDTGASQSTTITLSGLVTNSPDLLGDFGISPGGDGMDGDLPEGDVPLPDLDLGDVPLPDLDLGDMPLPDLDLGDVSFALSDAVIVQVRTPTEPLNQVSFNVADRGAATHRTAGTPSSAIVGYAKILVDENSSFPSGMAISSFGQNGIVNTEFTVDAMSLARKLRIYTEISPLVDTGATIINPIDQVLTVTVESSDSTPMTSFDIDPHAQLTKFLSQEPFNRAPGLSATTLTFSHDAAALALRIFTIDGGFNITSQPVVDLTDPIPPPAVPTFGAHFAAGGGWGYEVGLTDPTEAGMQGTIELSDPQGVPANVTINGVTSSSHPYDIPPGGVEQLLFDSAAPFQSGSIRVMPTGGTGTPSVLGVFSFDRAVASVPFTSAGSSVLRGYVETLGNFEDGHEGSLQSGFALQNISSAPVDVRAELFRLDGTDTGLTGMINLPALGQSAMFTGQIPGFELLPAASQNVLRLSVVEPGEAGSLVGVGLRARHSGEKFLITTTSLVDEAGIPSSGNQYYYVVDGGGWEVQTVEFSGMEGAASGKVELSSEEGGILRYEWDFR